MPAGDDHGARAHFQKFLARRFHSVQILHFHAREKFRLGHVGRDHAGALEEFVAHKLQSRGIEQFGIARSGARNRIENDVREFVGVEKLGDRRCVGAVREHSDFYACDRRIFGERSSCARSVAVGVACTARTPCVDCTVSAVTAATP